MPIGSPGIETFRDMIVEFRNRDIVGAMIPLLTLRQEVIADDEFQHRGGIDDPARNHFNVHLLMCDKLRRFITHNPESVDVGVELRTAIDPNGTLETDLANVEHPFVGEAIQNASRGLVPLPWAFDGSDPDIPSMSQINMAGVGKVLLGSIDLSLVLWSRLE